MERLFITFFCAAALVGCDDTSPIADFNGTYYCAPRAEAPLSAFYPDTFSIHHHGALLTDDTGKTFRLDMSVNRSLVGEHLNYTRSQKDNSAQQDSITVTHTRWSPLQQFWGWLINQPRDEWTAHFDLHIDRTTTADGVCSKVSL